MELDPIAHQSSNRGDISPVRFSDREAATAVKGGEGDLRQEVIVTTPREPGSHGGISRGLGGMTVVLHVDKSDVGEHPDERLRVVSV